MHSTITPGTFSLPGPATFTIEYLLELVQSVAYLEPSRVPYLPKPIMLAIAKLAQLPWFPMVSPDELERRHIDDVEVEGDWDVFGVKPTHIEDHALAILRRFRSAYAFLAISVCYLDNKFLPLQRQLYKTGGHPSPSFGELFTPKKNMFVGS
jgi:NADH dehydrogenase (ubiquinone) 1 alpha subcomplex subunit 9